MRKLITFFVLFLVVSTSSAQEPTVLIVGDSLSAGYGIDVDQSWATLLQLRLEEQGYEHRVVNASIGGETTEGGSTRIEQALETFNPSLVILELGGNDGLRGIPANRMQDNLENIILKSEASGADVVMLGIQIPTNYGRRYREAFERVFSDLANRYDIPWIEFFMEGIALNEDLMQSDGIHPNATAQPMLLDNAWPVILTALANQGS
ncbi:MAG: arylesterase [Woeseiaceae bacterium]|nr:arylesterase [Woeseiaceae bacterium]MDX2607001.1 arylesterase [Woeseiaceae bacterium]